MQLQATVDMCVYDVQEAYDTSESGVHIAGRWLLSCLCRSLVT